MCTTVPGFWSACVFHFVLFLWIYVIQDPWALEELDQWSILTGLLAKFSHHRLFPRSEPRRRAFQAHVVLYVCYILAFPWLGPIFPFYPELKKTHGPGSRAASAPATAPRPFLLRKPTRTTQKHLSLFCSGESDSPHPEQEALPNSCPTYLSWPSGLGYSPAPVKAASGDRVSMSTEQWPAEAHTPHSSRACAPVTLRLEHWD